MLSKLMHVTTPQILWHGGGDDHGKPAANPLADPVYSVDFHPTENILITTGNDGNIPPKGSVRVS
jgi:WD40 repeat protein